MKTLYEEIFKLKQILRKGWVMRNVPGRAESDAEHTFSMLILGLELLNKNDLKLDQLKVLKMIAYHELGEIDAGDITPFDNVSKEEKYQTEHECIKRLSKQFGMPEMESLWLEFEENKTPEAQFVKKLDKYDAVLQSKIYSDCYNMPDLCKEFENYSKEICKEFKKLKR